MIEGRKKKQKKNFRGWDLIVSETFFISLMVNSRSKCRSVRNKGRLGAGGLVCKMRLKFLNKRSFLSLSLPPLIFCLMKQSRHDRSPLINGFAETLGHV